VAAGSVLEEIVDPLFLEQPRHKIEMCFPVLYAELAFRVALRAADVHVGDGVFAQHLLHDVEHAQVLEDPAVAAQREEPERRHDLHTI
jgi:hypothetical protein